ncbi:MULTISPECIES: aldose 1-epimerase [unclassified Novosphingobium]|uniref:aldose 1-epimerase n=1 Tax=unclassified Novosphingobium TaxID=2644732 RepID=UPI001358752A|nr:MULTISPECIES: aldose 1-epimerase [unclassified Novosphingobium]
MSDTLVLRRGGCELELLPWLGGAIGRFDVDGRPVLRPTPQGVTNVLETASFPLVPYANRIAGGRFTFAGAGYVLPSNFAGFEHPLHGLGWVKRWDVIEADLTSAAITCSHLADEHWPWNWSATQHFALTEGGLKVSLELVNTSAQAMPSGLGQHPYIVRGGTERLAFAATGVWENDEATIPVRALPAGAFGDFVQGHILDAERLIDNCYFGWRGEVDWGPAISLHSRSAGFLHVFAPPGEDFICLEPTSQMPDALNRADFAEAGGVSLAPGARQVLDLEIRARPSPRP